MSEKDRELLDKMLHKILVSSAGIRYVILVDRSGITITYLNKFRIDKESSIEKLAAIGGAIFQAVEEQGEVLDYGPIDLQITEYKKGYIFSVSVGDGILCVATDKNVHIGMVRNIIKRLKDPLAKVLHKILKADEQTAHEELKSILSGGMDII